MLSPLATPPKIIFSAETSSCKLMIGFTVGSNDRVNVGCSLQ